MKDLVFDPLGMRATTSIRSRMARVTSHPAMHKNAAGRLVPLGLAFHRDGVLPSRPDGGTWSNVDDNAAISAMELPTGFGGRQPVHRCGRAARATKQQVATGNDTATEWPEAGPQLGNMV